MLPMYVCLQDMCFCIFFGLRRCSCVWMSHVFLLFLFFHYLIYFLFFFNCASLHVYECLLTHISRGDSAPMTWLTRACVCVFVFRGGAQPPAGRTSPRRTAWWCPCLPVRPAPGSSQPSWPAICSWPTYCWSTYS